MKCKDCSDIVWFGDYALHYCGITKNMVKEDDECSCPEKRQNEKEKEQPMNEELSTYEQLLCIVNGIQDFGVVGGMGDLVKNEQVAKALSEQGCIVVKPLSNTRRRRYKK